METPSSSSAVEIDMTTNLNIFVNKLVDYLSAGNGMMVLLICGYRDT